MKYFLLPFFLILSIFLVPFVIFAADDNYTVHDIVLQLNFNDTLKNKLADYSDAQKIEKLKHISSKLDLIANAYQAYPSRVKIFRLLRDGVLQMIDQLEETQEIYPESPQEGDSAIDSEPEYTDDECNLDKNATLPECSEYRENLSPKQNSPSDSPSKVSDSQPLTPVLPSPSYMISQTEMTDVFLS